VIQIASSYKIIKNTSHSEHKERYLSTLDIEDFRPKAEVNIGEADEGDPLRLMEAEIRRELHEENARKRKAIIDAAATEAEELKQTAMEQGAREGYEEGFRKGFEEGRLEAEGLRENAVRMIAEAEREAGEYFEECEEKILGLAVRIAEKIVHQTIDSNSEGVMLLARPILHEYGKTENLIITCSTERVEDVRSQSAEIEKLCPNARIIILEDRSLEKNGLVIENENQITDLQVKKQLQRFLEQASS
jgi:flagellar assembly protein FliH